MSILLADIDATCSSLGYYDGSKYYIETDAIQCLKVSCLDSRENFHLSQLSVFQYFST